MNFFKKKAITTEDVKTGSRQCIICQNTEMGNDKPVCDTCITKIRRSSQMPGEFRRLLNRMNNTDFGNNYYSSADIADLYHGMEKVDDMINELADMKQKYVKATVDLNKTRSTFSDYKENAEEVFSVMKDKLEKKHKIKRTMKKIKKSIHDFFDV